MKHETPLKDFFNVDTDNAVLIYLASILSVLIISSCVYLKIPQIQSIRRNRNANGVCLSAVLMEITGYTITTLYNFTNSYGYLTYLEYPIILVQLYILVGYILKYDDQLSHKWVIVMSILYIAMVCLFATGILPKYYLGCVLPLTTPISGFSKVAYIYCIICECNADNISRLTWIISIATNAGRIFTVIMDSADLKLLINLCVSTILSSCVLATAIYYQTCARRDEYRQVGSPVTKHKHTD